MSFVKLPIILKYSNKQDSNIYRFRIDIDEVLVVGKLNHRIQFHTLHCCEFKSD